MKKLIGVIVGLTAAFFIFKYAGGSSAAIKYNDQIVSNQNRIIEKVFPLSQAFQTGDQADMEAKLETLKIQIDQSLAAVSAMKAFKGNIELRDSAIDLFKFYRTIADNEYTEIINIISLARNNITEYEKNRLIEIQSSLTSREREYDNRLQAAQSRFAGKYGIKIKENKYQKDIDRMGRCLNRSCGPSIPGKKQGFISGSAVLSGFSRK
jgi:hypothetical protein